MVPSQRDFSTRRRFLAAVGTGGLAATAGCVRALGDAVTPLRSHVHHRDADLSGDAGPWPTAGADARRSGAVDGAAPPAGATARAVTTAGRYVRTQPVVAGTTAYLGVDRRTAENDDGEFSGLVAVDLAAERRSERVAWRAAAGEPTAGFTPAVAGNAVFAQLGEGMKALDARDGSVCWRTTAGGGAPAVVGETCYTYGDGVVALDAVTGERRWTSESTGAAPSGFAVAGDAVALACGDGGEGSLYCFEREDGSTRWRYREVGESYASAVTDGRRAYAVGTDGVLHAVTLSSGERVWTHRFDGESYQRVAVSDGTVYAAGNNDERVVALDAATGRTEWQTAVGVGGPSTPAVTPDAVLVAGAAREGRRLFVLDRASGAVRHRFELPRGLFREVQPVVAGGVAYVLVEPAMETQGFLYAVR